MIKWKKYYCYACSVMAYQINAGVRHEIGFVMAETKELAEAMTRDKYSAPDSPLAGWNILDILAVEVPRNWELPYEEPLNPKPGEKNERT